MYNSILYLCMYVCTYTVMYVYAGADPGFLKRGAILGLQAQQNGGGGG